MGVVPEHTNDIALRTPRLILRDWRDEDLDEFAALTADPVVMEHFPKPLDRTESDALAGRIRGHLARHGFGFWAVELPGIAPFIGFVGLSHVPADYPFGPTVEIGWRLARAHWGKGYATEAARAALDHGFGAMDLPEIVAFTVPANWRSRRVMDMIGMTRDERDDFDHPHLPEEHRLRRHVLYRIGNTR